MAAVPAFGRSRKVKKEPLPFSEIAMRHNAALLEYCRTSISALSGSTAGILGLTGLYGFIFYFVVAFLMSLMLLVKAGTQWQKYFESESTYSQIVLWVDFLRTSCFGRSFMVWYMSTEGRPKHDSPPALLHTENGSVYAL